MKELIKITEHNGQKAVSARELYDFLEVKSAFTTWIKRMFEYGFEEGKDFIPFLEESSGGRPSQDYVLSIDCAKEISMLQRSEKGKQARQYFIACENKLKEITQKPLTQIEIIAQSAQILLEQDKRISSVETKVKEIEAKTQTRPDYFTIVGYGSLCGMSVNLKQAASLGQKASKICKIRNIETDTIPDPRFGTVKMYPRNILDEVFNHPLN